MPDLEMLSVAKTEEQYGLMFPEFPWVTKPSMTYGTEEEAREVLGKMPHGGYVVKRTVVTSEWEPV